MKKIDDIFKEGLDQKGLEYSDAHWAGAEAIIEKNKIGFPVWRVSAFLLILAAVVYVLLPKDSHSDADKKLAIKSMNSKNVESGLLNNQTQSKTHTTSINVNNQPIDETKVATPFKVNGILNPHSLSNKGKELPSRESKIHKPSGTNSSYGEHIKKEAYNKEVQGEISNNRPHLIRVVFGTLTSKPVSLNWLKHTMQPQMQSIVNLPIPHQLNLYALPYINGQYYNRQVTGKAEALYKQEERTTLTTGFGLHLMTKHRHFTFVSGFGFMTLSEKTNYSTTQAQWQFDTSLTLVNRNYTQSPRGTSVALLQARIDSTQIGVNKVVDNPDSKVQWTYLVIPLHVQYEMGRKRLIWFGEAGMDAVMLMKATGNYAITKMEAGEEVTKMIALENNVNDLTKTLWQVSLATGVKYAINARYTVYGSYGYSCSLNSMMSTYSQKPITQKLGIGLEIGLWK